MSAKKGSDSSGKVWRETFTDFSSPLFLTPPLSPLPPSLSKPHKYQRRRLRNSRTYKTEEKILQDIFKAVEKKPMFQLVFLSDDKSQSVEVAEVEEIDFQQIKMHVENGDSVFITKKENEKVDTSIFESV